MFRQSLLAGIVYVAGTVILLYWSVSGYLGGAEKENWALMIVLPAAWIISFWPTYASLLLAYKIWNIQDTLERIGDSIRATGSADRKDMTELAEIGTELAAEESGIPQFIIRPFVRRFLARAGIGTAKKPELSGVNSAADQVASKRENASVNSVS